jgi:hypothetical protein
MSFDVAKWNKQRYLAEAGLLESTADLVATAINQAIDTVDESLSYQDFALAIAKILKEEYGSRNFGPFMEVLHAELGMNESLNEAKISDIETIDFEYTDREGLFRKARVYYKDGSMDSFFGAQFDKFLNDLGINQEFDTSDETDREIFNALKGKDIKLTFSEKDVS